MRKILASVVVSTVLTGCAEEPPVETTTEPAAPVYCYRYLASVECFSEPYGRDERRRVDTAGGIPDQGTEPRKPPAP